MDNVRPGIGQTGFVQQSPGLGAATNAASVLNDTELDTLDGVAALLGEKKFALLTGAGISTDSGIPDYRGPQAVPRTPLTYQEFMGDVRLRQRYWARNHVGWSHLRTAKPNTGHFATVALERSGILTGIVTQNVDRLHEEAGAENVVDLHGRFDQVLCMDCGNHYSRAFLATILNELNPGFLDAISAAGGAPQAPDADADVVAESLISTFNVAKCPLCGGLLKPDFVFFGENVPKDRVLRSFAMVDAGAALLVAGSSLTVLSGLRFVKKAAKDGKPVIIINKGQTRGDSLATIKAEIGVGEAMSYLTHALTPRLAQ